MRRNNHAVRFIVCVCECVCACCGVASTQLTFGGGFPGGGDPPPGGPPFRTPGGLLPGGFLPCMYVRGRGGGTRAERQCVVSEIVERGWVCNYWREEEVFATM